MAVANILAGSFIFPMREPQASILKQGGKKDFSFAALVSNARMLLTIAILIALC